MQQDLDFSHVYKKFYLKMTGKGSFVCIYLGSFDHLHQLFNSKWLVNKLLPCGYAGGVRRKEILTEMIRLLIK